MFVIDKNKCVDCGYCAFVCPFGCLVHHEEDKYWEIDGAKCIQCGQCFSACIASAIGCDKDQQIIEEIYIGDDCIGCSLCAKKCPVGAISGKIKEKFVIDVNKCIKDGYCATICKQNAIVVNKTYVFDQKGRKSV